MNTHNSIKIYPPTEKSPVYKIRYKHNGIRRSESRSTLEAAEKRVKEIAAGIRNGAGSLISLRQSTQEKIIAALNYLPEDTDLLQAVFEWAEAKKSLDEKVPLKDAVKFYNNFHTQNGNLTISALIDQLLIQRSKKWSDIHRRVTTNRLQRIKKSLGSIYVRDLDDIKIDVFFEQFSTKTPKYQNHYKALFRQLVKYAAKIKAIPDAEALELVLENEVECTAEPEIITPKQLDSYLKNAPEQVIPCIVLGSFAGLRPEEIQRLTWEDYFKHDSFLLIKAEVSKTSRMRKIPKKECLKDWMDKLSKGAPKKGKIVTISNVTKNRHLLSLKLEFGGPLKADAQGRDLFRHCYVSYRCEETVWDFELVSKETGHSVEQLQSSYLKLVDEGESKEWFSTFPDKVHK
jgi:integrase